MPLVKRNIEPRHLSRGALPEGIGSELECVTNNTLSAIIRQLSSLSKHAEDVFGELFNEANTFYLRANSLQDRVDRLAVKVTQLDSSVEEGQLQPFSPVFWVVFKQFCVHSLCNRDDHVDGMKFYTDPSYFFDLWKEKMLQDTEDKRKEKRRQREQKRCVDGTLSREVKKVRKARNRRQEWNMMALDKELRPDHRHPNSLQRGASSEGSLSPDGSLEYLVFRVFKYESYLFTKPRPLTCCPLFLSLRMMEYYASSGPPPPPPPPGPIIPSSQTAFAAPLMVPAPPTSHPGPINSALSYPLPPVPPPGPIMAPPPPGPPPPPAPPIPPHPVGDGRRCESQPITDGRSDLLSAIRMGIQLKKVQEQQEQQAKRERVGNDVATILSRRIAVEYSDSEEDSELEENEWSD
uniref:Wiskott-Aldrich syndrome protein family member n=1 Tax=Astyanax mexicanus TaxID=7994 RepID=A0A8B9J7H7_ASTMX